jgi:diguanylate cyclase (GGDEF)-like protein
MQYLDKVLDGIVPIKVKDESGIVTYINKAYEELTGYKKSDIVGVAQAKETQNKCSKKEYEIKTSDESLKWIQDITSPMIDKDGIYAGEISVYSDISEKKKFEQLSIVDGLTGLYNRRYFNEQLSRMIREFKRDGKILCLSILDIDNFKKYNDSYGHQAGDEVLQSIGGALIGALHRGNDYAFRLGGEEFGLLFEATDQDHAYSFVDSIRQTIKDLDIEHSLNGDLKIVTASFGLVTVDFSNEEIDDNGFYSMADHSLYAAKDNGRDCVVLHGSDSMDNDEDDLEFF